MISLLHLSFGEYRPGKPRQHDTKGQKAWRSAYCDTLRLFFGEHRIPPDDLLDELLTGGNWQGWEQWRDRTIKRLDDWDQLYYSAPPFDDVSCFITPPREDMGSWYLEVGHLHDRDEHTDLLTIPWYSNIELFFRPMYHRHHTDQTMRNTFFAPLAERIRAAKLDSSRIEMSISFANEHGLHTVKLPSFLQTLGLP